MTITVEIEGFTSTYEQLGQHLPINWTDAETGEPVSKAVSNALDILAADFRNGTV